MVEMVGLIIQAAEKQTMISHSGEFVKYQPNIQELFNMEGTEVVQCTYVLFPNALWLLLQGLTPLMHSVKSGHLETVQRLMKYPTLRCDYQNKVNVHCHSNGSIIVWW